MQYKSIILVDGENLCLRYAAMIKEGRSPSSQNIYILGEFVWNPSTVSFFGGRDVVRASYYTTVTGDDAHIDAVKRSISTAEYSYESLAESHWDGTLVPYVYKKLRNGQKTKSVDINLTIDALRYAYGSTIDQIVLISGDGDYIPLLREIMARGKMVQVWALSSGLNPEIQYNVDDLYLLDSIYFGE